MSSSTRVTEEEPPPPPCRFPPPGSCCPLHSPSSPSSVVDAVARSDSLRGRRIPASPADLKAGFVARPDHGSRWTISIIEAAQRKLSAEAANALTSFDNRQTRQIHSKTCLTSACEKIGDGVVGLASPLISLGPQ